MKQNIYQKKQAQLAFFIFYFSFPIEDVDL